MRASSLLSLSHLDTDVPSVQGVPGVHVECADPVNPNVDGDRGRCGQRGRSGIAYGFEIEHLFIHDHVAVDVPIEHHGQPTEDPGRSAVNVAVLFLEHSFVPTILTYGQGSIHRNQERDHDRCYETRRLERTHDLGTHIAIDLVGQYDTGAPVESVHHERQGIGKV